MTGKDRLDILRSAVSATSQAEVARRIGRSPAAINQILKGKYPGNTSAILERVAAQFGADRVNCPVMGQVPLAQCLEERNRPFRATNPVRVRLYRACKNCERNRS